MSLDAATISNLIAGNENCRAIDEARALIETGSSILFAGAGTSKPAGYPLWRELLNELKTLLQDQRVDVSPIDLTNLLLGANQLYDCFVQNNLLETHYYSFLYNCFAPKNAQSLELQQILLTLPFCGIVTTNWDVCFERAIHRDRPNRPEFSPTCSIDEDHPHNVRRFFDSLCRGGQADSVAHLHGVYDDAKKIILTAQQYARAYGASYQDVAAVSSQIAAPNRQTFWTAFRRVIGLGDRQNSASLNVSPVVASSNWTLLRKTVWALMATRRLIFVGFGMDDPFLYALFSYVSGDLWDKTGHVHYLITGIYPDTNKDPNISRRYLRTDLGIQTIFYEVQGDDHSRLKDLLYSMGAIPPTGPAKEHLISELLGPL